MVACVGCVEDESALCPHGLGSPGVHDVRGEEAEAGVAVVMVVGVEELGAERAGSLDGGERPREARAVLQGLELRLAERTDA